MTKNNLKLITNNEYVSVDKRKRIEKKIKKEILNLINHGIRDKVFLIRQANFINAMEYNEIFTDEDIKGIIEEYEEDIKKPNIYDDKGNIIGDMLGNYLNTQYDFLTNVDTTSLFYYTGLYYEMLDQNQLKCILKEKKLVLNHKNLSTKNMTELHAQVMQNAQEKGKASHIQHDSKYISFANGVVDLDTGEIVPHSPHIKTFGCFDFDYDENAIIEGTKFEEFIKSSLSEEHMPVIQEIGGNSLSPNAKKLQKFVLFLGDGGNGKSVLLDIFKMTQPRHLISNLSISDFEHKYKPSTLEGKSLNIQDDDNSIRLESLGNFKKAVCGEDLDVERKGIQNYTIQTNFMYIGAINNLPSIQEVSNAFNRRAIIIDFPKTFGTQEQYDNGEVDGIKDVHLIDKIKEEMPIVINWFVQGAMRLRKNDYKLTMTEDMKESLEHMKGETNTVYRFIKEKLKPTPNAKNDYAKTTQHLHDKYEEWCILNKIRHPRDIRAFRQVLKSELKNCYKKIGNQDKYLVEVNF